jgi:hypothetical protein
LCGCENITSCLFIELTKTLKIIHVNNLFIELTVYFYFCTKGGKTKKKNKRP